MCSHHQFPAEPCRHFTPRHLTTFIDSSASPVRSASVMFSEMIFWAIGGCSVACAAGRPWRENGRRTSAARWARPQLDDLHDQGAGTLRSAGHQGHSPAQAHLPGRPRDRAAVLQRSAPAEDAALRLELGLPELLREATAATAPRGRTLRSSTGGRPVVWCWTTTSWWRRRLSRQGTPCQVPSAVRTAMSRW